MKQSPESQAAWMSGVMAEHEGSLVRYALRFTGDLESARDIVQDTFVKLWQADRSSLDGHLAQWLFTVCRNRALDVARKEQRMQSLSPAIAETQHAPPPDAPDAQPNLRLVGQDGQERRNSLLTALSTLPERQQEIVRLKFQNGLSYEEISRVTSLSVSNIGFILHTAIKALRAQLQQPQPSIAADAIGSAADQSRVIS